MQKHCLHADELPPPLTNRRLRRVTRRGRGRRRSAFPEASGRATSSEQCCEAVTAEACFALAQPVWCGRLVCVRDSLGHCVHCWLPLVGDPPVHGPRHRASRSRQRLLRGCGLCTHSEPRGPVVGWLGFPVRPGQACKAILFDWSFVCRYQCMIRSTSTKLRTGVPWSRRPKTWTLVSHAGLSCTVPVQLCVHTVEFVA